MASIIHSVKPKRKNVGSSDDIHKEYCMINEKVAEKRLVHLPGNKKRETIHSNIFSSKSTNASYKAFMAGRAKLTQPIAAVAFLVHDY